MTAIVKTQVKRHWLKAWAGMVSVGLVVAVVLAMVPVGVSFDLDGILSIGLSPSQVQAQEPSQPSIKPGFGWAQTNFTAYAGGFMGGEIYDVTCPDNINSGSGVSFSFANYTLTYHLSGGKMQWTDADGTKTKSISAVLSSVGAIQPDGDHNKIAYTNAFLNTAVEYRAYSVGVKEVFVLSTLPYNDGKIANSYLEYTGELTWDSGLSVWVDDIEYPDKTFTTSSPVDFRDTATNETVFSFLAPVAWDSSDSRCAAVYDVKVSEDKVQYGLRVPYSWLQTAVFPVTIDPSFTARTETYVNFSVASDFTVTKPTGTVDGDILFCWIGWYSATATIDSVPSGWTLLGSYTANTDKYALYYKIAASEPASWDWSLSVNSAVSAVCSCYTGGDFDPDDPIDIVSNTAYRATNTACIAASMTVAAVNSPLVFWGGIYTTTVRTFTKPSVPTTDWIEDDDNGSSISDFCTEVCSMIWSGSGATGDMSATITTFMATKHAFAVALNPAAGVEIPTVTTQAATDVASTSCTGNGNITATGGENCHTRGFCYMVGTSGDPTTADSTVYDNGAGSYGTGAYTKSITGLTPSTGYRVRAYAINSAGTGYGTTVQVTTLPGDPDNLTDTAHNGVSVDLEWTKGTGADKTLIRYRTDQYPTGTSDGTQGYFDTGNTTTVESLSYGQIYYFRAWAYNTTNALYSSGTSDRTCFTDPNVPTSFVVTETTNSSIALSWVLGTGSDKTMVRYRDDEYPTGTSDGTQAYFDTGTSVNVTSLVSGQIYYFRAWSYDTDSGYYDSYAQLTETTIGVPTAITQAASNIGCTTARINGKISDDGGESCEARFRYKDMSDYGQNWTDLGVIVSGVVDTLAYLGNGIALMGDGSSHVYRSTDYGLNWTDLGVIAIGGANTLAYLGNGIAILGDNSNHVYRSTDYGLNWTDLGVIASNSIYAIAYLGNGIAILGDDANHVYRSTDYGQNWTDLGIIASNDIKSMAYLNNGIAILGDASYHVFRSTNYGLNWTDLGVIASGSIRSIAYLGNGIAILGDWGKHVFRSTDYGATWDDLGIIATAGIRSMAYLDNGIAILGDWGKHVFRSTDYGATWDDLGIIATGSIWCMAYLGNGIAILGDGSSHVYRSTSAYDWVETNWQNTLVTNSTYYKDLTALDPGTEYEFRTQAKNSAGEGDWSASAYFTTCRISNTPSTNDFGILQVNTTGNTAINYFTIENTGGCTVDVTIQGTDATGGDDTWTLSDTATPGENIYGLYAGLDDADDLFDVIVKKTATYNTLVSGLVVTGTQDWGLKIYMPTSLSGYDAQQMTGTVTLVASAA